MSNHIVAIDLGSSFIKGAVAQKDEQGMLRILAVEQESSKGIKNGVVINPSEVSHLVKNIIVKLQNRLRPIEFSKVYVGVNGNSIKTISNSISFDFTKDTELTESVLKEFYEKNEAYNSDEISICDILPQEFLLDGEPETNPLNCMAKTMQANYKIVLGKKLLLDRICAVMERIPLDIAGIFTAPPVTAEALTTNADKELGCAVIDFGGETTSVCVYADNLIRHVAVIPFGGKTITRDISNIIGKTLSDAEEMKITQGGILSALQNPNTEKLPQIIQARMNEIADFICIEIDKSGYYSKLRNGLIITGGSSALDGIAELLNMKSGFDVRFASYEHLLTEDVEQEYVCDNYAQLVGLLHFGTDECKGKKPDEMREIKVPKKGKGWLKKMGDGIVRNLFEDRA